ncbi:hypothetical protein ACP4OV_011842 [Aristida adscensionis]
MAGTLVLAVVQEAITRVSSVVLSKREEKASREHSIERLEVAHSELELAVERSGKLPITDISLLRRRKILKRAFEECSDVLHRCKRRSVESEEVNRGLMLPHSFFAKRIAKATKSSIAYLFTKENDILSCSDVRRFEWFAECAGKFVRDVESGCSLRHHTFSNPLVRHLLEGKTLSYKREQGSWSRDLYIWPICMEERGIEAELSYQYKDYNMPEKSFHLAFRLRLLESTNIVGIAIICLQYLASQFKLVAECAMGELILLADLQDISHSYAPPWVGIRDMYARVTEFCRPDPLCCKPNVQGTCAKDIISSELSNKFPEQVIAISFQCYASAVEYNLHSSGAEVGRDNLIDCSPPLLLLKAGFAPHGMWKGLTQNYDCKTFEGIVERKDGSIEQEIAMLRSNTIDCLFLRRELSGCTTVWQYAHGFAFFHVRTSVSETLVPCSHYIAYSRSMTWRCK